MDVTKIKASNCHLVWHWSTLEQWPESGRYSSTLLPAALMS